MHPTRFRHAGVYRINPRGSGLQSDQCLVSKPEEEIKSVMIYTLDHVVENGFVKLNGQNVLDISTVPNRTIFIMNTIRNRHLFEHTGYRLER
jgi:hypothetical protein